MIRWIYCITLTYYVKTARNFIGRNLFFTQKRMEKSNKQYNCLTKFSIATKMVYKNVLQKQYQSKEAVTYRTKKHDR